MLSRILNIRFNSIASAAFFLAGAALASRVLGLVRDRILAGMFGAGDELDIYFAAFRIPDLVYNIVIAGAVSSAFIPVFMAVHSKNKNEAWNLASNFLNVSMLALVLIASILVVAAPLIVPFLAPGFNAEKTELTVVSTRIMFLSPIFLGLSAIFSGILHSFRRFMAYSLGPIFYNACIIFGAVFFVDYFGVHGLALGVAFGALLHFVIQVPPVFLSGFSLRRTLNLKDDNLRKIFTLLVPRAIGLGAFQINLLVITAIASTLAVGSISVFNLANNLQYIPIGIVGISFATAAFPALSESASSNDRKRFIKQLGSVIRMVFFMVLPLSVIIFILRAHIVRIALGSGEFGWVDTRLTAAALGLFCVGIFAHSLVPVLSRAFYAKQDTKTPVVINIAGMAVNVALSFLFVFWAFDLVWFSDMVKNFMDLYDVSNVRLLGLPFAFSVAGIADFTLLFYVISRKCENNAFVSSVYYSVFKISLSSIASGVACYGALFLIEPFVDTNTFWGLFMQAAFASVCGAVVYLAGMFFMKSQELYSFLDIAKKRLRV